MSPMIEARDVTYAIGETPALRAASLAKAAPERTEEIVAARERLSAPEQMGTLFRVMAMIGGRWPQPEGF